MGDSYGHTADSSINAQRFIVGNPNVCSENVTINGKSYLANAIVFGPTGNGIADPGIATSLQLDRVWNFTAYMRRDRWEYYCDGTQVEVNPSLSGGPC